ncbi:peptide-binding protein [Puteibacter caeruleilacunae]|nr:peptide-binding protein [Puteibacter caeruleilacunae]
MKNVFLFIICLFITTSISAQLKVYVADWGSDSNNGSVNRPVKTFGKALNIYRTSGKKGHTEIIFREGTWYFDKSVVLTNEDSGTEEHPLIIKAYPREEVTFDAGHRVFVNWKKTKNGIFKTKIPSHIDKFEQMWLKGEQQILARYPNYNKAIVPFGGYAADATSADRVQSWKKHSDAYAHVLHNGRWGGFHYIIEGIDAEGKTILKGGWQNNRPENGLHPKFRFVENVMAELDTIREWYFDKKQHTLYFMPENIADIMARTPIQVDGITNLITIQGQENSPVKHIEIKGISFQHTGRTFMETKEQLLRSDWAICRNGAVKIEQAEDINIESCEFFQLGGNAVFVSDYNRNVKIQRCHIHEVGASGIAFVGNSDAVRNPNFHYQQYTKFEDLDLTPGPKTDNYPSNCIAHNNLIHDFGTVEKQVAGVQIAMASKITVSHNSIYDCPRAGINIGDGTWGGHLIEFNDVFNTVLETSDHGSFNSWGRDRFWQPDRGQIDKNVEKHPGLELLDAQDVTVLRNNRMRCDHGWDIDLDDGSTNYFIYNNLCLNNGIKLREGYHRTVVNNICVNNSLHPHVWQENCGDMIQRNIFGSYYFPIAMKDNWGTSLDFNLFDITEQPSEFNDFDRDNHSVIANPLFIDPVKGDYRVAYNSPAFKIGFHNFAMNQFGVTDSKLKSIAKTPLLPTYTAGLDPNTAPSRDNSVVEWLGGKIKNLNGMGEVSATGMQSETGVILLEVPEGSELEQLGFKLNDVIIDFWGQPVHNVKRLMEHYKNKLFEHETPIGVWRDQTKISVNLK